MSHETWTALETAVEKAHVAAQQKHTTQKDAARKDIVSKDVALLLRDISALTSGCEKCHLAQTRTNLVFGQGNPNAKLVFVGEAPGADEDEQGLAFVGKAGQLLTKIIEAIKLKREEVYICNILKCRPPGNRTPTTEEIACCMPYLMKQLEAINPPIICALGNVAAHTLLNTTAPMNRLRGRFHKFGQALLMPTYHPAALLRNPDYKKFVWEDVQMIQKEYEKV
ncbi:uracil-DNA glycosylase [Candidatus Poribacteria bacterium]|nr:uracil-DNA glycosylase [Candidatus Poribacteria bacterium]